MAAPDSESPIVPSSAPTDDAHTGLPVLRTWRAVYLCVGGIFVLWLVLLTAFTWWYA